MGDFSRDGDPGEKSSLHEELANIAARVKEDFAAQKRVLSFEEFLAVFSEHPARHGRDAANYTLDMIESYGVDSVSGPGGEGRRYRIFDLPFLNQEEAEAHALVGQEPVQQAFVQALQNFRRGGRTNRVLMLHGPNGSAKSTFAACLMRGLEDYSSKDEGALYRFHWVFPKKAKLRGAIGFSGGERNEQAAGTSYAHLPDEELETKLVVEVRDHPLFLIPAAQRRELLSQVFGKEARVPRWLSHGTLCHKNQQIFAALLTSYDGSLSEVLRHVQVERYFLSRRYRVGAVTLGPELSVDATERQVTADRNLGALPTSLQGLSLFDVGGELVDAGGGILELSDLLKRPIDAFKYLQITAETGEVSLGSQNLQVNCVLLASANELHLTAFREHPEFESFRGRFELIPAPYLRDHRQEKLIYDRQVVSLLKQSVAPHATAIAARFAVLTRLLKPVEENYEDDLKKLVGEMSAWTKMAAYASEMKQVEVDGELVPVKRAASQMLKEWEGAHVYEGITGASPRAMRGVLLAAAQNPQFDYLSPFAVLEELDRFCEKQQDFSFLRIEVREGGFHDHQAFRRALREWLLDTIEDEVRQASGLVDETRYEELLARYVSHVSASIKGEKIQNQVTGALEPPDERLMVEIEELLDVKEKREEARANLMSRIAAWAIEHPGQKLKGSDVYREKMDRLRAAAFMERRAALGKLCKKLLDEKKASDVESDVSKTFAAMKERFGYSREAARDAVARLFNERFQEVN